MKRFAKVMLAWMLVLCLMPVTAQAEIKGFADKIKEAVEKEKKKIAPNDGLTVKSPEQYLGIDPCDDIYQQDNYYYYVYRNRGWKYSSWGSSNPVDWYKMEEWIDALVDTGYYEIIEHKKPGSNNTEYYCLGYVGPKSVKKTFGVNSETTQKAAIAVQSFMGDIYVWFSVDITADDLDETQERLGKNIFQKNNNNGGGSGSKSCTACGSSGNCSSCGGRGEVRKHVAGTTDWIYQDCLTCLGSGDCRTCGGDGWR